MSIDWFTVIAQVINFLVLLAILKFVLFDRIVAAVDARKHRLASERRQAEEARREADAERERAESARKQVEDAREQQLREARNSAEERRRALEQEARQEAERMRERFRAGLREEQQQLIADLVRTSADGVTEAARRALEDLADTDLDQRMVQRFCRRLGHSDAGARESLEQAFGGLSEPLLVRSSRELGPEERAELGEALRDVLLGGKPDVDVDLRYQVDEDLVCGIEVSGGGRSLGWSIHSYLSDMEDRLHAVLEEETARDAEATSTPRAARAANEPEGQAPAARESGGKQPGKERTHASPSP